MESSIAAFLMRWLACELLPTKFQIDQDLLSPSYALHRVKLAKLFLRMLVPVRETKSSQAPPSLFQGFASQDWLWKKRRHYC